MRLFSFITLLAASTVIASASSKRLPDDANELGQELSKQPRTADLEDLVADDLLMLSTGANSLMSGWEAVNPDLNNPDHLGWEVVTQSDRIILQPTNSPAQQLTNDEIAKILGDTNFVAQAQEDPARLKTKRTLMESLEGSVEEKAEPTEEEALYTPKLIKNIDQLHDWIMANKTTPLDAEKICELANMGRKAACEWLKIIGLNNEIDAKAKDPRVKVCLDPGGTEKEIRGRLAKELNLKPNKAKTVLRRYRYMLKYGPEIYGTGNIEDAPKPSSAVAPKKARVERDDQIEEDENEEEFDAEQPEDKIRILRAWMLKNQNEVLSYKVIRQILGIKESSAKQYYSIVGMNDNINELASDERVQDLFKTWDKRQGGSIVKKIADEQGISFGQADLVFARLKYIKEYGPEIYCKRTKKFNGPKYQ
jgi:hypothetical protein